MLNDNAYLKKDYLKQAIKYEKIIQMIQNNDDLIDNEKGQNNNNNK